MRRNVELEKMYFFFGHWAKTFRPDSVIILPRKWKFHSSYAEDRFWEHISKKICNLQFCWSLSKTLSNARRKLSGGFVKTAFCILQFQRNNVVVYFFLKKYQLIIFLVFKWKNSAILTKFFRQVCINFVFCVQKNIFDQNFLKHSIKLYFIRAMN